jgi:predicted nucleic-acid-binding protein
LLSVYKVSRERIAQDLESLLAADGLVMQDKARYAQALRLFAGPIPHFGDACACAAALEDCDGNLLSFDRKLSRIDGVTRLESV